jgi:hypothetical protein
MALHGFAADAEPFRDPAHTLFGSNQTEYCKFAITQDTNTAWERLAMRKFLDRERGYRGTDIDFSRGDSFNCVQ